MTEEQYIRAKTLRCYIEHCQDILRELETEIAHLEIALSVKEKTRESRMIPQEMLDRYLNEKITFLETEIAHSESEFKNI